MGLSYGAYGRHSLSITPPLMGIAVLRIRVIGEPGSYEPMPEMLLLLILSLQFRGFLHVDCCYKGKPYLFYGCHLFPVMDFSCYLLDNGVGQVFLCSAVGLGGQLWFCLMISRNFR